VYIKPISNSKSIPVLSFRVDDDARRRQHGLARQSARRAAQQKKLKK
jgi:hypothetical protein